MEFEELRNIRFEEDRIHLERRHKAHGCGLLGLGGLFAAVAVGSAEWLWLAVITGLIALLFLVEAIRTAFRLDDVVLDLGRGALEERRGSWPFARWERIPLSQVDAVERATSYRSASDDGGASRADLVRLTFRGPREPVTLHVWQGPEKAREIHERLARELGLDAVDTTGSTEARRSPEELDLSLGEKLEREGTRPDPSTAVPPPPEGSGIDLERSGEGVRIVLPLLHDRTDRIFAAATVGTTILALAVVVGALLEEPREWGTVVIFTLMALGFGWFAVRMVRPMVSRRVIEEREGVLVLSRVMTRIRPGRQTRRVVYAKEAIETIDRVDASSVADGERSWRGQGIRIHTDRSVVGVGAGLDPESLDWLEEALVLMAARDR